MFPLFIGILVGFFSAVYIFAVDIDILTIPYINRPVTLKVDLTLQSDKHGIRIVIPKGSQIVLKRRMHDQDFFSVDFTANWGQVSHEPENDGKKFYRVVTP